MAACNSGDLNLDAAVNGWLKHDKNLETRKEVLDDISNSRWDKLRSTMLQRQRFGTAGLRAPMGAGYKCMNDVVILQTAQGTCSYIRKLCSQGPLHNGVVVGYDGRYNSKRFAELTAKVFVSASIPVHLFSAVCPTPLVSFATIMYKAAAGVMVTASHNPKEDNGYKVYWGNGSQIIWPHDDHILEEIKQCLDIPDDHWNISDIRSHELVKDCLQEVTTKYMEYIRDSLHGDLLEKNSTAAIDTVYSAMHGVGYDFVVKAFQAANLKVPISVPEQESPDPAFTTVKFPNPEEPECLELSMKLAAEKGIRLVLVNDPDADRLAVAEYDPSIKSWKVFTGNEMGALLGWWLLKQNAMSGDKREVYVIASVVSSRMLQAIVKGKGEFVETLTGFKWMGNTTLLLSQQGKLPLFAFEEAIGYMCSPRVPDKDGVSAAVQVATLGSHLYSKGSSLSQQLNDLYAEFGFHVTHNSYYVCHDPNTIQRIFRRIRNYHGQGQLNDLYAEFGFHVTHNSYYVCHDPNTIQRIFRRIRNYHGQGQVGIIIIMSSSSLVQQLNDLYAEFGFHVTHNSYYVCHDPNTIQRIFRRIRNYHGQGQYPKKVGSCEIVYINDLTAGVKMPEVAVGEGHLNVLGTGLDQDYNSGEMVMFRCHNGLSITVRTSGTEPKIKYYSELVCQAHGRREQWQAEMKLTEMVQEFIDELIQPKENGLVR